MKVSTSIIAAICISIFCTDALKGKSAPAKIISDIVNLNQSTTAMKVTIGSKIYRATLKKTATTDAFKSLLPLQLAMADLNDNEKYYDLPNKLPANASIVGNIKRGDILLYGNNTIVIFYKNLNSRFSYTKLGSIDDAQGLEEAMGSGTTVVKFEQY
ncbi:MAG: hypothetical protein EOO68_36005 [Moraxellaceae bacterium]|nr:MAG: hypothetical protein EOO68_36005 [Moraxellaceae bacterium]